MDLHYCKAGDQRGVRSGPSLHKRVAVFPLRSAKQVRQLGDPGRDLSRHSLVMRFAAARLPGSDSK